MIFLSESEPIEELSVGAHIYPLLWAFLLKTVPVK